MCWSSSASLLFGGVHMLTLALVRWRAPHRRDYIAFLAFYALMEFFQAAQWTWGDLLPPSDFGYLATQCSTRNSLFTICAYLLIWVQPTLYSLLARRPDRLLVLLSLVTLDWALFTLLLGRLKDDQPTYRVPNSNYGLSSCSEIGQHGHIGWRFAPLSVKYAPNDFVYFLLVVAGLLKSDWRLMVGWSTALIVSLIRVGTSIDLPAYWCGLSVMADIPILINVLGRSCCDCRSGRKKKIEQ